MISGGYSNTHSSLGYNRLRSSMTLGHSPLVVRQDLRLHVGPKFSRALDNGSAESSTLPRKAFERGSHVPLCRVQPVSERKRVARGLRDAHSDMRSRDEGGVAE